MGGGRVGKETVNLHYENGFYTFPYKGMQLIKNIHFRPRRNFLREDEIVLMAPLSSLSWRATKWHLLQQYTVLIH